MISLDTYDGNCKTLSQISGRIGVPNKTGNVNTNSLLW